MCLAFNGVLFTVSVLVLIYYYFFCYWYKLQFKFTAHIVEVRNEAFTNKQVYLQPSKIQRSNKNATQLLKEKRLCHRVKKRS